MDIDVRKALTQSDSDDNIRVTLNVWAQDTPELRAIITEHLPAWAKLFARKNSEYGSGAAFDLGERGQFSDIYRKIIKLKRAMWDEDESVLTTEGVDEILMDLIGHCFLTLEMRARKRDRGEINDSRTSPKMTREEFEGMVKDAGMFVLPTENSTIDKWEHGGRVFRVADSVRFKHHLGKGQVFKITGFDPQAANGNVVRISYADGGGESRFVHPAWLYHEGEKSPEEEQLERIKIAGLPSDYQPNTPDRDEYGFFKDDPNTAWQKNDGRSIKDDPQA